MALFGKNSYFFGFAGLKLSFQTFGTLAIEAKVWDYSFDFVFYVLYFFFAHYKIMSSTQDQDFDPSQGSENVSEQG